MNHKSDFESESEYAVRFSKQKKKSGGNYYFTPVKEQQFARETSAQKYKNQYCFCKRHFFTFPIECKNHLKVFFRPKNPRLRNHTLKTPSMCEEQFCTLQIAAGQHRVR